METVAIDKELFRRRIQRLVAAWTWPLDAIVIVTGKATEEVPEFKSNAMHYWLLGIGFPETTIGLVRSGRVIFFASTKKLGYLRHLEGPQVVLMPRGAGAQVDDAQLRPFAAALCENKEKATVGTLLKERHEGPFAESVLQALPRLPGMQVIECKEQVALLLAPKQADELALVRKSAVSAVQMLKLFFTQLENIIDQDLKQTNKQICDGLEKELDNEDLMRSWEQTLQIATGELDFVYTSLQSGKRFEILPGRTPTDEEVPMQGSYLLSIGMKYTEYSSCLSRTIFVDPTPIQKDAYTFALEVHWLVISCLKPNAVFRDVYLAAKARVQEKRPALVDKLPSSVGFVLGLEFRGSELILSEACHHKVVPGMVFCVSVGFADNSAASPWAVWLADTAIVPETGPCEVLTSGCSAKVSDVMYELDSTVQEANEEPPAPKSPPAKWASPEKGRGQGRSSRAKGKAAAPEKRSSQRPAPAPGRRSAAAASSRGEERRASRHKDKISVDVNVSNIVQRRTRGRNEKAKQDMHEQAKLEEQQIELRRAKLEEIRRRVIERSSRGASTDGAGRVKKLYECQAYEGPDDLPATRPNRLELDAQAEALLVPIRGAVVPFHVSTIKNMARSTMDKYEFLRVNFFTPGQGKGAEEFPAVNGRRLYVKELSFRSLSKDNIDAVLRGFKEMQKKIKHREIEGEVRKNSTVTEHEPLQIVKPCPSLRDLNLRPNYGSNSRKTIGNLEAHANGFRFSMKGGAEKIDILYSQCQHVIFEPCESGSLIVLFHLHLKDPMMLGKKKTQDLQFYTEVTALTEDLSLRKAGSIHDPDEILEEQREREMTERLNNIFLDFSKRVEAIKTFGHTVDIPHKALAFSGVPYKQVVTLCPCKSALVALQEWPPFVLDLSEVDIVVFERLIMTLREFDITFVKKDYEQSPIRITTIPQSNCDTIRRWLANIQAVWYSCTMNLQWQLVMKDITKDYRVFIENGGWDQWFRGTAVTSGSEDEDDDDCESDYNATSDDANDKADDADSDFSVEPDEDESDPPSDDDDDEGMSWDELEKEAEKSDKKRDTAHSTGAASRSQPPRKSSRKR